MLIIDIRMEIITRPSANKTPSGVKKYLLQETGVTEDVSTLEVVGTSISLHYSKPTSAVTDIRSSSPISLATKDTPAIQERYPLHHEHQEDTVGPLVLLNTQELQFHGWVSESITQTITLSNIGSTVIYYNWNKIPNADTLEVTSATVYYWSNSTSGTNTTITMFS
jgi:hypothetical protein